MPAIAQSSANGVGVQKRLEVGLAFPRGDQPDSPEVGAGQTVAAKGCGQDRLGVDRPRPTTEPRPGAKKARDRPEADIGDMHGDDHGEVPSWSVSNLVFTRL